MSGLSLWGRSYRALLISCVQIPVAPGEKFRSITATFFPEEDQNLDIKGKPSVEPHPTNPGHHIVKLPIKGETPSQRLKGILIVQGKGEKEAYNVDIPVHNIATPPAQIETPTPEEPVTFAVPAAPEFEGGLALALLFAFVGGMILNLMPCVLPVMSFKVLGFV